MARFTVPVPSHRLMAGLVSIALAAGGAVALAPPASAAASGFSAGDVVVYRTGTGAAALTSAGTAVSLDEYSPSGTPVQSVALPTTASGANKPLVASGSASSEGLLTLSADGRYLVATGYDAAVGTSGVSGSAAKSTPRTIARVDASDTVDTSTSLTDFADGNNARSAASNDGTGFWAAGAAGGVRYAALGASTSTQLTSTAVNLRQVQVIDGQLYVSGDSTKAGGTTVATVGSGLPTSGTQSVTNLVPASNSPEPFGYSLLTLGSGSTPDTLYVADQTNGGVGKYSLVNGTWTAEGSIAVTGIDGLTANDVQGVVTVFATTPTGLYSITDSSGAAGTLSGSASQIVTAPSNTAFRGVAFAPGTTIGSGGAPPANPAPTITAAHSGLPAALGDPTVPSTSVTIADKSYDASQLTVTAASSDQTIAASSGITITGSGATRTVGVTPAGATGKATITLTVTAPDKQTGTTQVTFGVSPDVGRSSARYYSGAGNASAAIDVGGGYAVLGDDENNILRLYDLDSSGPAVKSFDFTSQLPFGSTEMDIEAAARSGNTIYWEGSMSNTSGGNLAPARSTIFATTVSGSGADTTLTYVGAYTGLRQDLINWDQGNGNALGLAASAAGGVGGHDANGLNLEGMEFAGSSNTLYLSFRAPLEPTTDRHLALLVPLTNVTADIAAGASASGTSSFGSPIELDLGGLGVRDIKENADGQYLISAGTADDSNTGFVLYYWDGNPNDDPQQTGTSLPQLPSSGNAGSWETIVSVPDPLTPSSSVRLIQDDGSVDWYGDGLTTKSGELPDLQKSLGVIFDYTPPAARASVTTIKQDSTSAPAGTAVTYTATVAPAAGNGTPSGTVDFQDGGSDIAACAAQPIAAGTATCTVTYSVQGGHVVGATYGGDATFSGSSSATVTHAVTGAALDHLGLSPANATTTTDAAHAYTAEGYDAYGNDLGDMTASSTFTIAPTSGGASCTANSCVATIVGTYTVTAKDGGATGSTTLSVTAGPLATITLSPATASVRAGGSKTYTATGADRYGNPLGDETDRATFVISGSGHCTANSCTATATGRHVVTGTVGSVTGTATLTAIGVPTVAGLVIDHGPVRGGTVVTIIGKNLTAATRVRFGTRRATHVTVVSSTRLRVVSPKHSVGTVDVRVTTPGGTSAVRGGDHFTYVAPVPTVSSLSPASGSTHGGTRVTIRGTGFTHIRRVEFGSRAATRVTVVSASTLIVTTPRHSRGAVSVVIVTTTGRSAGHRTYRFVAPHRR